MIILTNNPDVAQTFQDRKVLWVDGSYRDVLIEARDLIHQGRRLQGRKPEATDPSGQKSGGFGDRAMIAETFDKFAQVTRPDRGVNTPERMLADFRMIDLSLIESALEGR